MGVVQKLPLQNFEQGPSKSEPPHIPGSWVLLVESPAIVAIGLVGVSVSATVLTRLL